MTTPFRHLITASAIALVLQSSSLLARPESRFDVPPVPLGLEVPEGFVVFYVGHAAGTQNYICLSTAAGISWKFIGPQATLYDFVGQLAQQTATHFLSANPAEQGLARPSWLHSFDSSQVWGRVRASSSDPNHVEPGAIPWLLVEVTGAQAGPTGGSLLAQTAFIHRVNTSGGVAPSTGCGQVSDIGALALVPYTTDYFFYRPAR